MCGIAGFVRRTGRAEPEIVAIQLRTVDHRGPDSWGVHARGRGAIGQTRLAIIDLATGDPPIETADGVIGVALNGEIYNYRTLREQLEERSHRFRSAGDTEVIAHLAEELDPVALASHLEGMFAFAVWDSSRERLALGRDRFGKKPLYWWRDSEQVVFGSEIKTLLAHPAVTASLDPRAIPAFLHLGYVPSPRTFYEGIQSVPPGHVLVVDGDLGVSIERYWRLETPGIDGVARLDIDLDGAATLVRSALSTAVVDRMVADVPLGAFLSGGVDSSLIVALMARATEVPVRTFTIGFDDRDGYDERPYAALVAKALGTEHVDFVVRPAAVDLVERLVWHHDQAFGDSSAVNMYLLAELTAREVTVALAGDGGDELFGGYERFSAALGVAAAGPALLRPLAGALGALSRPLARARRMSKGARFLAAAGQGLPGALREWSAYIPWPTVCALTRDGSDWAIEDYEQRWLATEGGSPLDRILLLNAETYLLDDLLPKVDRMAMAHALEVRTPFLDHRLAELAFRLPPALRATPRARKRVLRRAAAGLVPDEVIARPKKGFGVPLDRWFRDDLATFVADRLGSREARVRTHLDGGTLDLLLAEHGRGTREHGGALWSLLTLEVFLRERGW